MKDPVIGNSMLYRTPSTSISEQPEAIAPQQQAARVPPSGWYAHCPFRPGWFEHRRSRNDNDNDNIIINNNNNNNKHKYTAHSE